MFWIRKFFVPTLLCFLALAYGYSSEQSAPLWGLSKVALPEKSSPRARLEFSEVEIDETEILRGEQSAFANLTTEVEEEEEIPEVSYESTNPYAEFVAARERAVRHRSGDIDLEARRRVEESLEDYRAHTFN